MIYDSISPFYNKTIIKYDNETIFNFYFASSNMYLLDPRRYFFFFFSKFLLIRFYIFFYKYSINFIVVSSKFKRVLHTNEFLLF